MKRLAWIWIVLAVLVGCQPVGSTATVAAPVVWRVQVSPALRWLNAGFHTCTGMLPGVTLLYDEKPAAALDPAQADFTISLAASQPQDEQNEDAELFPSHLL